MGDGGEGVTAYPGASPARSWPFGRAGLVPGSGGRRQRARSKVVPDARLRDRWAAQPWFLQHLDEAGTIRYSEGPTDAIFGDGPAGLLGRSLLELVTQNDRLAATAMWLEMLATPGCTRTMTLRIGPPAAGSVWVSCTVMNRLHEGSRSVVVIGSDVTEKMAQDEALRASQQEFRMLAEALPTAVFRLDDAGRVTYGNHRWFELIGPSEAAQPLADVVQADHRRSVEAMIADLRSPKGPMSATLEAPHVDGSRMLSISLRVVVAPEVASRGLIGEASDITDTTLLRHVAEHDPMTGTLSRYGLGRHLETLMAAQAKDGLLVVFVDLDGFKAVNDQHGHVVGDDVLRAVAERLGQAVRPADLVGRFGGDEFVVLCHDTGVGAEGLICDRIEAALVAPVEWPGGHWYPRASMGTARGRPGDDPTALIRRADQAMYEVKRSKYAEPRGRSATAPASPGGTDSATLGPPAVGPSVLTSPVLTDAPALTPPPVGR
jgi:diguanylate cyclase (GGDEF)-like protein